MKPGTIMRFLLLLMIFLLTAVPGLTISRPINLENAAKSIGESRGDNSYLIGSFKMLHTQWSYTDSRLSDPQDLSKECYFDLFLTLQKLDSEEKVQLDLKPITGSNVVIYKYATNKLLKNDQDPYWIVSLDPGTYQLTNATFKLVIRMRGYETYHDEIFIVPVSRDLKRNIIVEVKSKQLIYLGDYLADFKTNIILDGRNTLWPFSQMKLSLSNNFEATKAALMNAATENTKAKLAGLAIISAI